MKSSELPIKLSKPAQRALAGAGIRSLEQLAMLSKEEFLSLHGIGKSALEPVTVALKNAGLHFRKK